MTQRDDSDPWGAPQSIRDLEVLEEIEQTDDSIVYRARRRGRDYAVRLYRGRTSSDSGALEQFRRDAALHASLEHPLIPTSYEVGVHEGRPFVVNEYVDGQTLEEWVGDEPLSEKMAVVIAGAVAGALAEIHDEGLVHGHIDPTGIVLADNGEIKLLDFGLAASRDETGEEGGARQLQRYAAPEQVGLLERPVDGRADLYSVGSVLFELIASRPVGSVVEESDVLARHHAVAPPSLADIAPDVSPAFGAIVDKLLEGNPEDRYQSARRLRVDVGRVDALNERHRAGLALRLGTVRPVETDDGGHPFIGREEELERLRRLWERADDGGEGTFVVLEGPAGSGKTRLMREMCREIVDGFDQVIDGRCLDTSPVPFGPLRAGLESYVERLEAGRASTDTPAVDLLAEAAAPFQGLLGSVSPKLAEMFDDEQAIAARDSHEVFYNAFASLFASLADEVGGLLLWVDDAQWIDDATLDVLRGIDGKLADHPILLVCSSRNGSRAKPALEQLIEGVGEADPFRIELEPFGSEDVGRLIGQELGEHEPQGPFVDTLIRESRGNPFLLRQQLRSLRDSGTLAPDWDSWTVDGEKLGEVRQGREPFGWVVHRIEQMPPAIRRTLTVASVLGHVFSLDQIRAVCREQERSVVDDAIRIGFEEGVLSRDSETGLYTFAHDRIREALFERFGRDEAVERIRRRAAEYLDDLEELTVAQIYERARHYLAVIDDEPEPAVIEALWMAAEQAVEEFAYEDAYVFFQGIEDVEGVELVEASRFYELFAEACFGTDRLEAAVQYYERALEEADASLERSKLRADIAWARVRALDSPEARRQTTLAFDELGIELPSSRWSYKPLVFLQIAVHWLVTMVMVWTGIGEGRASGREQRKQRTLVNLFDVGFHVGYYGRDKLYLLQSAVYGMRPAHRLGASREYSIGFVIYATTLALLGRGDAADKYGTMALENAERLADRQTLGFTRQMYAASKSVCGELDEAIAIDRELLEADPEGIDSATFNLVCIDLTTAYLLRGRAREGYEVARDQLRRLERLGGPLWEIYRMRALGELMAFAALLGRHREAEQLRERVFEIGEKVDPERKLPWVSVWGFTTLQLYQRGADDEAIEASVEQYADFEISPDEAVHHSKHGYIARGYARLAQASRADGDEADERMAALREALESLDVAAEYETVGCHVLAVRGGYRRLNDEWQLAEETLEEAVDQSEADGNIWAKFEARRQQAKLAEERRRDASAQRFARRARELALEAGWRHRVEELEEAFDLERASDGGDGDVEPLPVKETTAPASEPAALAVEPDIGDLSALASMTVGTSSETSPESRVREILDRFVHAVEATRVYLCVREPETGEVVYEHGRDRTGADLDAPTAAADGLVADVLADEQRLATGVSPDRSASETDNVCVIALPPLFSDREPFAALYAENLDGRRVVEPDQVDELLMLGVAATSVLQSIDTAEQGDDSESTRRMEALLASNHRLVHLGESDDYATALRGFLQELRAQVTFVRASICWDDGSERHRDTVEGETVRSPDEAVDERRGSADAETSPGARSGGELLVHHGDRITLDIPLCVDGEIRGMAIIERDSDPRFSDDDIERAMTMGADFSALLSEPPTTTGET